MMKLPILLTAAQTQSHAGVNPFAATLLAESFADNPATFGDDNVLLGARAHNGQEVWILLTKTMPTVEDFAAVPPIIG